MEEYLFTFCGDHEQSGHCQPIFAESYGKARQKMFELHSDHWGFQYSREEWDKMKHDPRRYWPLEEELSSIYANKGD